MYGTSCRSLADVASYTCYGLYYEHFVKCDSSFGNIFIYSFDVNYVHPVQESKAVSVLGIHHLQMHFCRVRSRFILNIRMESAALTDRKNLKWPANG